MKSGMIAAESIFDLLSKSTDEKKTIGKKKTMKV
jgi:flavin-dependent dehydrogenase